MIAVLLAAGFATRMYPLTENQPKPLLPIASRPVINHLVEQLVDFDSLESIYVVSNGKFINQMDLWSTQWRDRGFNIHILNDGVSSYDKRLGAVGDLRFALESNEFKESYTGSGLIVAACDNIFSFSIKPYYQKFETTGRNYLFAVEETDPILLNRTGVLELDSDDRVLGFHEKPSNPPSNWKCPAFYFLSSDTFDLALEYCGQNQNKDEIGHMVSHLVAEADFYAFRVVGDVLDIGTLASYEYAREHYRSLSDVPVK